MEFNYDYSPTDRIQKAITSGMKEEKKNSVARGKRSHP